jgi:hypothetical protein
MRDLILCIPIIRVVKSRRMNWDFHVARTREERNAYRVRGKPERKGQIRIVVVGGRIILKWI